MTLHRFYCPDLAQGRGLSEYTATITGDEARHAVSVLRLSKGDHVALFDGQGCEAVGIIQTNNKRQLPVEVIEWKTAKMLVPIIEIAVAIPKGPRADAMVQQLSQVGVDRLIPLRCARSVVDPGSGKVEKFRRAAVESAKQCSRSFVMQIADPCDFKDCMTTNSEVKLIADSSGSAVVECFETQPNTCLIMIGPEGGWTPAELEQAVSAGFQPWRFGPHIMRIETAAVVAAGISGLRKHEKPG